MQPVESNSKTWKLTSNQELRFEVEPEQTVYLTVTEGTAEIFGTELALQRKYKFSNTKLAVFTWHGCGVTLSGTWSSAYTSEETPMVQYVNTHHVLEERRKAADQGLAPGPRVVICGPVDSGKSSLSKILLSYATRMHRKPVFVDLDLGQGAITLPGCLSATSAERPVDPEEELNMAVPLAYWFGGTTVTAESAPLYRHLLDRLASVVNRRMDSDAASRASGMIINTMGWVDGIGYDLLRHAIDTLKADVILVLNHDRLFADLQSAYGTNRNMAIVKLQRSGGVVERSREYRTRARTARIRDYFYGVSNDLSPHQQVINFDEIVVYRVGGGSAAPATALPVGAKPMIDPLRLTAVVPTTELVHSVLAVSHAPTPEDVLNTNVAGFVRVTDVDLHNRRLTVVAPAPGHLPGRFLVVGTLKWLE